MSKKILLADDSVTIQKVITITFASEDYELEVVGDGDAAIAKAKEFLPDIILADVAMPGKTGYEVSEIIKKDRQLSHIPVLLLAGTFEPLDEAEAARVSSDGCIVKPFESQELIDKVAGLLGKSGGPAEGDAVKEAGGGFEVPEEIWAEGDFAGISEEFDEKAGLSEEDSTLPDLDFLESGGFLGEPKEEAKVEPKEAPPAAPPIAPPITPVEAQSSDFIGLEDITPDEPAEEPPALEIAPEEPSSKEGGPYVVEHFDEGAGGGGFGSEPAKEESVDAQVAELLDFSDEAVSFGAPETPERAEEPKVESPAQQSPELAAPEPFEPFEVPELTVEETPAPDPVAAAAEAVAAKAGDEVAARLPEMGGMPREQIEEIVRKVAREVVEKIAWDVVPELAQELIEEEVNRFRKAWKKSE